MSKIHAYFISGLGADHRVFERLKLDPDISIRHLPWLDPSPDESMDAYARRMGESIQSPDESVIVGLSFGGIMAIEIAKRIPVKKVVLISSVKSKEEMPIQLNLIGLFNLHRLIPASKLINFKELTAWFFGVAKRDERAMLDELLNRTDEELVDWSTDKIVQWQGEHDLKNIVHIHGTADTVFPIRNVKADYTVQGGPHFMVYTHPEEVSKALNEILLKLQ